ncbi:MAG: hypothetical protein QF733_01435 [Phycisphaerales bacterium]|nr:hypothetical protein [Phycisphaerales bacterium]
MLAAAQRRRLQGNAQPAAKADLSNEPRLTWSIGPMAGYVKAILPTDDGLYFGGGDGAVYHIGVPRSSSEVVGPGKVAGSIQ